jgi:hypothetical protein
VSHHGESPLAQQYPKLDICDVFLFRGNSGTVFIQTLNPLSGPGGFHPGGLYEFNIDTSGRGAGDAVFRVSFGTAGPSGHQPLQLELLAGGPAGNRDATGEVLASGVTETVTDGGRGIRIWAGRAADPFYIHPAVVTAVAQAVQAGAPLDVRALIAAEPSNLFAGHNVNAIVLEVPDDLLLAWTQARPGWLRRHRRNRNISPGPGRDGWIGFWATTVLRHGHGWLKVQRCATPLIPTIFFAPDGDLAAAYNTTEPAQDRDNYGPLVGKLAGQAAAALGAAEDPRAHGSRVADALFPDILWYQLGTPAQFGFGQRNGRGLTDPVAEVMFALVTGRAIPLGLDKSAATGSLRGSFPYLSAPLTRRPASVET